MSLWNAGCCILCDTDNLLIGIIRWKLALQLCWTTGKRGLVLLGMHISWPGLSPLKLCLNSGWDFEHKSGRRGGEGRKDVAGSFIWALKSGAHINCNEKKVLSFLGKTEKKIQNFMSNMKQLFSNGRN